uniref:ASCH domain-containing protein n=1 Tax=Steinernema glaseri TaxID=37863 RepID=A0A1I7YWD1_9BILA
MRLNRIHLVGGRRKIDEKSILRRGARMEVHSEWKAYPKNKRLCGGIPFYVRQIELDVWHPGYEEQRRKYWHGYAGEALSYRNGNVGVHVGVWCGRK